MLREPQKRFFSSYGLNHFLVDRPFQSILKWVKILPEFQERLEKFGEFAGSELLEVADYIDRTANPQLQMWDIQGQRFDWVRLDPAHVELLQKLLDFGFVRSILSEKAPWQFHYALGYLLADPGLYCTIILCVQTAYALQKYGDEEVKKKFLPHYLDPDSRRAWFGATFYTETQGGSDLGANRAIAKKQGSHWQIFSKDKYFASSAGIADGVLVTARPEGRPQGVKGLALFFVPALSEDGSPNYIIRRLKQKLGTRAVPTGEVELDGSEAYLLGTLEQGIYQALEILTIARLANAVAALGIARKAYLEAFYYAQKRHSFGKPLINHPLVRKDFLEMEIELEANLALTFKAVEKFNRHWQERPPYSEGYHFTRFLTHIAKNMTAEVSAMNTRLALELHGGLGFLEEFPMARWHREALITPIWEGSSNIQALDLLELMNKKQTHEQFFEEINRTLALIPDEDLRSILKDKKQSLWVELIKMLDSGQDAQYYAKEMLTALGELAALDALYRAGIETDPRFLQMAHLYAEKHLLKRRLDLQTLRNCEKLFYLNPK